MRALVMSGLGSAIIALAACAQTYGPVFGDWYGFEPLPVPQGHTAVELVLYGAPNETTGLYRLHSQQYWPGALRNNITGYGSGSWTATPVAGHPEWREIDLSAGGQVGRRYVMLPDRTLLPAVIDTHGHVVGPNLSPAGLMGRLGARDPKSFGYGRI